MEAMWPRMVLWALFVVVLFRILWLAVPERRGP